MNLTRTTLMAVILTLVAWASPASAHDVRPGETVRGEVPSAGASAVLDLDLAAGDSVKLKLKAKGGGIAPALEVRDPADQVVAAAANERKAKVAFTAAATGTYRIRLASNSVTAPRFILKVSGDAKRSYSDRDGALVFGARPDSRIKIKVKGKSDASAELRAGGALVASDDGGRKIKMTVDSPSSATDYSLAYGPAGAKAKVKVAYPAPRGALEIALEPADAPAGSYNPPADDEDDADEEEDESEDDGSDDDQGDGAEDNPPAADGGDGTVGNPGDGTVPNPNPAPITDHAYLTDLLERRASAEIESLRMNLGRMADRPVCEVMDALEAAVDDPIVLDIRDAVADRWNEAADGALIDAMVDMIEASRRADRAQRAQDLLAQVIPQTALNGDGAYDAGQAMLSAGLAGLRSGIQTALEMGLRTEEQDAGDGSEQPDDGSEDAPVAPSYDAPPSAPAANEVIAGYAAMDAAALQNAIMTKARLGEPAAIELAEVLYEGYEARLTANVAADANAPATLAAIAEIRAELEVLRRQVFGIEFEIALVADPRPARDEAYELAIAVFGAESDVEYEVEGAEVESFENDGAECRIRMVGHAEPREVIVRARHEGEQRELVIFVEPGLDEEPVMADLHGRVVNEAGEPLDATFELRTTQGATAVDADGQPVAGATDADGFFEAHRVPAGEYELAIHVPGFGDTMVPVMIENEDPIELAEIEIR